ncbi:NACHT domain-containing protein [Terrimonas pollutisoli]|uniref:NACHT domain-containing protein n=1 Tax=Terrimonas pollutisoli TaxID=3034147 RepID=UPI0023EE1BF1|nr:NACHT domain-containing protein [Terrimonas sp. H1YJ31]
MIFYISKGIWLPADHGKNGIRTLSLVLFFSLLGTYSWWDGLINNYAAEFLPITLAGGDADNQPSAITLIAGLLAIIIVNYFIRDRTAMVTHSVAIDKDFPEKDFQARLTQYVKVLDNHLNNIDLDTNWSDYNFTPIEAEVEVISESRRKKKISDLMKGIRADRKSQSFLVLGDPGSGKSVALRKLARDLLKEVPKSGKIPIYINLKEWIVDKRWTAENPPTVSALLEFVLKNLKDRSDVFAYEFLDTYFVKMYDHGRLFFLLDSFDEIPGVLDASESSWVLDELSDVIYKFLAGAHDSRGILASRVFRKPTAKFKAKTTFELRPFSELKIEQTFNRSIQGIDPKFFVELFKNRPHLVPIARNPFLSNLMIGYCKDNKMSFPKNQAQIFESYLDKRLDQVQDKVKLVGLTKDEILYFCKNVSYFLFSSEKYGLEIETAELIHNYHEFETEKLDSIIELLTFAKIARLGPGRRFSFVHRRFHEYFAVMYLKTMPELIPLNSIPEDSRWRDALVLFCEIGDDDSVRKIAEYCWSEIIHLQGEGISRDVKQFLRSMHSLRFLAEAFKIRRSILDIHLVDLKALIRSSLDSKQSLLVKKYCLEATGLLPTDDLEEIVLMAFGQKSSMLQEIAFKSSRYLPRFNKKIENNIIDFVMSYEVLPLLKKEKELTFSLSLSDAFINIKKHLSYRCIDYRSLIVGATILFFFQPILAVLGVGVYITISRLVSFFDPAGRTGRNVIVAVSRVMACTFLAGIADPGIYYEFFWFMSYSSDMVKQVVYYGTISMYLFIFPFWDLFFFIRRNKEHFKWPDLQTLLIFVAMISFPILILYINRYEIARGILAGIFRWVVIPFLIIAAGIALFYLLKLVTSIARDYKLYRMLKSHLIRDTMLNRSYIEENFYKFKLSRFRYLYVRALYDFSVVADGDWNDHTLPNTGDDEASSLLTQMEEKWLKLA